MFVENQYSYLDRRPNYKQKEDCWFCKKEKTAMYIPYLE